MTVLITGFGPFDGGSNASEALVHALTTQRSALAETARTRIETLILPVDTDRAGDLLFEAMARHRPTHLLMTGQAAGRAKLCLERYATNRRDFRTPDAAGVTLKDACVFDRGPDRHAATWPDLEGTAAALNAAGLPAEVSEDCGTHLCNQVLYLALHAAASPGQHHAAAFLHVPLLPEQVAAGEPAARRHDPCPSLPLEASVRGVGIILAHAAALEAAA